MFTLKLALRYLSGRKLRSFLTTFAIIFGVMIIFGLNGMLPAIEKAWRQSVSASTNQADLTVTSETRGVFDANAVGKVRKVPGIAYATVSLTRPLVVPPTYAPKTKDGKPISSFMLNGIDYESASDVRPLPIEKGRSLLASEKTVLISSNLAERTGLKIGDTLRLPSTTGTTIFQVIGLVDTPPTPGAEALYIRLGDAQRLFNLPGKVNTIEAQFSPGSDREEVRTAVLNALGSGYKLGGNELGSELLASMKLGDFLFNMFGVLALAMGGFIIFNTFRTIVAERRRDIAMLRALGASRGTVLGLILAESLLQGVIGTAIGMAAGYAMVAGILVAMGPLFEEMAHIQLGGPTFSTSTYVAAIGLGIGITVLSGLMPALSASHVLPLEALRPPMAEVVRKRIGKGAITGIILIAFALAGLVSGDIGLASLGAVLFLAGLVLVAPALIRPISTLFGRLLAIAFAREGQIAQGNLVRQPGRAAITASAMMIGLAIIIMLAGMSTSIQSGAMGYLNKSMRSDYLLMPQSLVLGSGNVGAGPKLIKELRETPGVASATTLRLATTKANGEGLQVIGIDPGEYPELSGLVFSAGDPDSAYRALADGRAMIVNGIFAAQNGVKVGQTLTLQTPDAMREYKVVGIGGDLLNAKLGTGYISQDNLAQDFNETADLLIMANRAEGASATKVKAAIQRIVDKYPAFTLFSTEEFREDLLETYKGIFAAFYVLMLMLAIPSLIALVNTLGINVIERTREIGMLRAVGATRNQVRRMIVAESLLLSMAGIAFGILSGLWMGYILVAATKVSGFVMPYFFPYSGLLLSIAAGLIIGVVAAIVPARHAARLNIVSALQYE
ncbi:MAG TPA: FtsX-like permease family protein [Anaerolineae bacterium]|nr:FtsX-like permease family protein [Anaerolineae bacterium]